MEIKRRNNIPQNCDNETKSAKPSGCSKVAYFKV